MIIIQFPYPETKRKALGKLVGRFAFRTWGNGEMMVTETALSHLATEKIAFTAIGPADEARLPSPPPNNLRRYEILMPSKSGVGQSIPPDLAAETVLELEGEFGAVTCETPVVHGVLRHEGRSLPTPLARAFVDVADTPENRQFFIRFKEQLKQRFQQEEIWMATYPIEVI